MSAPSRTLTVQIDRPPEEVLAFLAEPPNLPRWAKRVCRSMAITDSGWIASTPVGPVPIRFVKSPPGSVEILVTYWPGQEHSIPIRVQPADGGSRVEVTMVKPSLMSNEEFPEDVKLVELDLENLKALLAERLGQGVVR